MQDKTGERELDNLTNGWNRRTAWPQYSGIVSIEGVTGSAEIEGYRVEAADGHGGLMRTKVLTLLAAIMICSFMSVGTLQAEQGLSVGYGLAAFMADKQVGKVEGGKNYDFIRATYLYERPFNEKRLAS